MDKLDTILEAAAHRFAHYGFRRSSVDDIARDAGIAKGSVYLLVESKEDLFLKTIDREQTLWCESNERAIDGAKDPQAALHALVMDTLNWMKERPLIGRLMIGDPELGITPKLMKACTHGSRDEVDAEGCSETGQRKFDLIGGILRDGIEQGIFRKDLSIETTVTLIISIFHIQLHNQQRRFIDMDQEAYIRESLRILFEGVRICKDGFEARSSSKEQMPS